MQAWTRLGVVHSGTFVGPWAVDRNGGAGMIDRGLSSNLGDKHIEGGTLLWASGRVHRRVEEWGTYSRRSTAAVRLFACDELPHDDAEGPHIRALREYFVLHGLR